MLKKNFFRILDYYFEEVFVGCQLTTKNPKYILYYIVYTLWVYQLPTFPGGID